MRLANECEADRVDQFYAALHESAYGPKRTYSVERFGGINGSAYFIAGFGMTALVANHITVVPIRSGVVGLRLGANLGYLKFTDRPTWNPF